MAQNVLDFLWSRACPALPGFPRALTNLSVLSSSEICPVLWNVQVLKNSKKPSFLAPSIIYPKYVLQINQNVFLTITDTWMEGQQNVKQTIHQSPNLQSGVCYLTCSVSLFIEYVIYDTIQSPFLKKYFKKSVILFAYTVDI